MSLPRLNYKETWASILGTISFSLSLRALTLGEASCHSVSCPMERPIWQGSDVYSESVKIWGLSIALWVSLDAKPPSVEVWDDQWSQPQPIPWLQSSERPWTMRKLELGWRHPAKSNTDSWQTYSRI